MKFEIIAIGPAISRVVLNGRADAAAVDGVEAALTAQLRAVEIAKPRAPDHTQHPARAQRHLDEIAVATATFGRLVVQNAAQRLGSQHADQLSCLVNPFDHHPPFPFCTVLG